MIWHVLDYLLNCVCVCERERERERERESHSGESHVCASVNEGNVLFNDALNTFYLRLYSVGHMVTDHTDSDRGNLLSPHGLLFPISSKGSYICTIPHTGVCVCV